MDFISLGRLLSDRCEICERRTAVGRAYYGIFNLFRNQLQQLGIKFPDARNPISVHTYLIDGLRRSDSDELKVLGSLVDGLRAQRAIADYDIDTKNDARFTRKLCKKYVYTQTDGIISRSRRLGFPEIAKNFKDTLK